METFSCYWPYVRGIHRSPVNSPHKGQWRRALVFSLICVWINGWINNIEAGDLRHYRAHYDVTVMLLWGLVVRKTFPCLDVTMSYKNVARCCRLHSLVTSYGIYQLLITMNNNEIMKIKTFWFSPLKIDFIKCLHHHRNNAEEESTKA